MNMKKKKIFLLPLLTTSIVATSAIAQVFLSAENNISQQSTFKQANTTSSSSTTSSGLKNLKTEANQDGQVNLPLNYYAQNDIQSISNDNGPILLFDGGKAFGATDWYGNPAWYVSLDTTNGYYSSSWYTTATNSSIKFSDAGTKVVDWAYNHNTDNLYVLTDSSYLIIIQSKTGQIVSANKVFSQTTKDSTTSRTVNKIQIIDFNNSVYLWNSAEKNPKIYQVDPKTGALQNGGADIKDASKSTWISEKYLFALIPLDVNYSIAVTWNSAINEATDNSSSTLTLNIVTDKMEDLSNSSSVTKTAALSVSESISLSGQIKGQDIYTNAFKRNSDYVVFIYNKIYTFSLNKSSIGESKFSELTRQSKDSKTTTTSNTNPINSAYIDSNYQVYYKTTNSTNLTSILVNNSFTDLSLSSTNNSGVFTSNNTDSLNVAQVFPVPVASSSALVSQSYTGYVLSPKDFTGTGIKNNSILTYKFTDNSRRPQFTIPNVTSMIPSSVGKSMISAGNTIQGLKLDNQNATLIADDITGVLYVRVPYIYSQPWYDNNNNLEAKGFLIGKLKCQSAQNSTTWNESSFKSLFSNMEPNQINETMLNDKGTQILNIPQSILSLQNSQLKINFIIKERKSDAGKIKLGATVSYVNAYGLAVSYQMTDKEFDVKKAAKNYDFSFAGVNSTQDVAKIDKTNVTAEELIKQAQSAIKNNNDTDFLTVDISTITNLASIYKNYASTIPSFWQVNDIKSFIVKSEKYTGEPVITTLASDDESGTIIISVVYNNLSNSTKSKFAIKYKGITTATGSQVKFQGNNTDSPIRPNGDKAFTDSSVKDLTKVSGYSDYSQKLSSDVKANELSNLYSSPLITSMGFTPDVSIVENTTDSSTANTEKYSSLDLEYGSILVKLDFSKSESSVLTKSNGKKLQIPVDYYSKLGLDFKGCVYQRYIGMLPIGSTYGITLNTSGTQYKALIMDNNVNSSFSQNNLLGILNIKGYKSDEVSITNFTWSGENLIFTVHGQSKTYDTVNTNQTFNVSWSPKFAAARDTSLAVAVITSLVGITLVSVGIALYIIRRNKIRKMLK